MKSPIIPQKRLLWEPQKLALVMGPLLLIE